MSHERCESGPFRSSGGSLPDRSDDRVQEEHYMDCIWGEQAPGRVKGLVLCGII